MIEEQERTGLVDDSRGMASILITMITMIVVTLIVLGFATISRREQGNTLDKQLGTQAFYAAESAVNDAKSVLDAAAAANQAIPSKSSCNTNTDGAGYSPNYPVPTSPDAGVVLDSVHNVSYTCLLVDTTPSTLQHTGVGDNPWVIPVTASASFDSIKIEWTPNSTASGTPSSDCPNTLGEFDPASGSNSWKCKYGVLRMDLVPTSGALTGGAGGSLLSSQLTAFFEPQNTNGGGIVSYGAATIGKANIIKADCNVVSYGKCTATVTGLSGNNYTLRLASIYQTSDVTVTALSGGTPVPTTGQILVDATGNANGVLRRIRVLLSENNESGDVPRYAIQSNSALCKRFFVSDGTPNGTGYYSNAGDVLQPQNPVGNKNYNAMCDNSLPASGTP